MKVLGTPVGSPGFVQGLLSERLEGERKLWQGIPFVSDPQCAWQLVVQCAVPMANHVLRTVPPSLVGDYAQGHDAGVWVAASQAVGGLPEVQGMERAQNVASLPSRLGGLGLRSAVRTAPAAYWASWADALEMLGQRLPALAARAVDLLEQQGPSNTCLDEVKDAAALLDREGFFTRPTF